MDPRQFMKLSRPAAFWRKRKTKYYNPDQVCYNCTMETGSPHKSKCDGCVSFYRKMAVNDHQMTLDSIRADWHR